VAFSNPTSDESSFQLLLPNAIEEPNKLCHTIFDQNYWITGFLDRLSNQRNTSRKISLNFETKVLSLQFIDYSRQDRRPKQFFSLQPSIDGGRVEATFGPDIQTDGTWQFPFYIYNVEGIPYGNYVIRFKYVVNESESTEQEHNFNINGPNNILSEIKERLENDASIPTEGRAAFIRYLTEFTRNISQPQYDIITFGNQRIFNVDVEGGSNSYRPMPLIEVPYYWINPDNIHEDLSVGYRLFYPTNDDFSIHMKIKECGKTPKEKELAAKK
jgi:hypothetical protein